MEGPPLDRSQLGMSSMTFDITQRPVLGSWPSYKYDPLGPDEIRIVTLLPGAFDDELRIRIRHCQRPVPSVADEELACVDIEQVREELRSDWWVDETLSGRVLFIRRREYARDEPLETQWHHPVTGEEVSITRIQDAEPKYEALSYAWGDDLGGGYVSVETSAGQLTVSIRANLAAALLHLRCDDQPRDLWIDALCIDQSNHVERGLQVQQMHTIFKLADRVIIWLGAAVDHSSHAMSTLRHLAAQVVVTTGMEIANAPGCAEPSWYKATVALPYDRYTEEAIIALLLRDWFDRLWVVQEIKLANARSIILCGSDKIPMPDFVVAMVALDSKRTTMPTDLTTPAYWARLATAPLHESPVLSILDYLRSQDCSDPRDHIYGALGIAPAEMGDLIKPDYQASVAQVYHDASVALATVTDRADILMYCSPADRQHDLPSWCPDWSTRTIYTARYLQQAAGSSRSAAEFTEGQSPSMAVHVVRCGIVEVVSKVAPEDPDEMLATVLEWYNACADAALRSDVIFGLDMFVRTTMCGFMRERYPRALNFWPLEQAQSLMLEILELDSDVHKSTGASSAALSTFNQIYQLQGERMFSTTDGMLGLTQRQPRTGDTLAVILGCQAPIIIRAKESQSTLYEVVGPCYATGLMDAEALLGKLLEDWTVQGYRDEFDRDNFQFRNAPTSKTTDEDPRLPPLPHPWVKLDRPPTSADPNNVSWHRNTETGEEINGDPRLEPEALLARGVKLERVTLV